MAKKAKTWLDNIWEGLLMIFVGSVVGVAGIFMLDSSVPVIISILFMAGFLLALYGLVITLITLYLRLFKQIKSYSDKFISDDE